MKSIASLILATMITFTLAEQTRAAITIQFEEIGGDVIATTFGSLVVPSTPPYYNQLSGIFLGGNDHSLYYMNDGFTQWMGSTEVVFSELSLPPDVATGDTFGYSGDNLFVQLGLAAESIYTPKTTWTWKGQTLNSLGLGYLTDTPFTIFNGFGVTITFVMASIPESSTTGLLAGAACVFAILYRKRR